jgi:hypothetical protein
MLFLNHLIMDYTVIDVKIESGKDQNTEQILLEPNNVVKMVSFVVGTRPTVGVDMKITTNNNETIHPAVPYQEFEARGGSNHFDSSKDILMTGNRVIKVSLVAADVLTADFTVRTIFYHETI